MHDFLKLIQQETYFEEFLGKHLDLKTTVHAMIALCPSVNMQPVLCKGLAWRVNKAVDDLNPRLTRFFEQCYVIRAMEDCLDTYIADLTVPKVTYPKKVQDLFQVKLTVNHMRTHGEDYYTYKLVQFDDTFAVGPSRPLHEYLPKRITHFLAQLKYLVRFQDGVIVRKRINEKSPDFNRMTGKLPHPPNAWGLAEVVWVEISTDA